MGLFSFVTDFFTGGNQGAASQAAQNAVDVLGSVKLPDIDKMKLALEDYVQQGVITPEMANTILANQTAMADIKTDPRLRTAQLKALSDLQAISDQGGMTTADRGRLLDIQSEENARERGQREAILQGAKQRGVYGSGLELASQLANQQGSATRASQRGFDVAKEAERRSLEAIMNTGQLGGQIRGQDWGEQSAVAAAKDAINKFNVANQNTVNMANVDAMNKAQYANLGAKQNIANLNTQQANLQQMFNKNLYQQAFENEMKKKGAMANAYTGQASNYQKSADRTLGKAEDVIGGFTEFFGF